MKEPQEDHNPDLDRLSLWLKEQKVRPRPDFLSRLRQRIEEDSAPVDQLIDQFLEMDPTMRNPKMVNMVRDGLQSSHPSSTARSVNWFSWLTPLAAAATLTLAFVSFQKQAPDPHQSMMVQDHQPVPGISVQEDDPEITRIFALAANLHSTADMSKLQSVEDLASLFD